MMNKNFCPAAWVGMFSHNNRVGMCCADANLVEMTPKEFLESSYINDLRQKFLQDIVPDNCRGCFHNEANGLQSIRQHFLNRYGHNITKKGTIYLELRASNLCNMSCRMCKSSNSTKIAQEVRCHHDLSKWFGEEVSHVEINDERWQEIKLISLGLDRLNLTGGEPMLIKKYYELLDYIIEHEKHSQMDLVLYTNASVYNPIFIEKMLQFKTVRLNLSIDGTERTAEYQRTGISWSVIEENIQKFQNLPVFLTFHTTLTIYNLLDFSALAKYYCKVLERYHGEISARKNQDLAFMMHMAGKGSVANIHNLPNNLRYKAIIEIEKSLAILQDEKFNQLTKQLTMIRTLIEHSEPLDSVAFVDMTVQLDSIRQQSFEQTFGVSLTP